MKTDEQPLNGDFPYREFRELVATLPENIRAHCEIAALWGFELGKLWRPSTFQDDKAKVSELRRLFDYDNMLFSGDIKTLFEILERAGLSK